MFMDSKLRRKSTVQITDLLIGFFIMSISILYYIFNAEISVGLFPYVQMLLGAVALWAGLSQKLKRAAAINMTLGVLLVLGAVVFGAQVFFNADFFANLFINDVLFSNVVFAFLLGVLFLILGGSLVGKKLQDSSIVS